MMIYIGIDNGLSGGLAAVHPNGYTPHLLAMPTRGKARGNELDAEAVYKWIRSIAAETSESIAVILETPGKFSKGVQAISSMWDSYGALRAVCEVMGLRHHRITPQQWQKVMLPGCAKGDTKPAALQKVRQLWPEETWLATPRSSKPHEGLIEAALIAEYGRRCNL
jgi:hypothetical protein